MADVAPTYTEVKGFGENAVIVSWTPLNTTDTAGSAIQMPGSTIRSAHITGTFDSCTVKIQGSNTGSDYISLADPQGNAIEKTAAAIESVQEITRYIKPVLASAGANTSITVTMLLVRRGK